jgi:hypothetical protein
MERGAAADSYSKVSGRRGGHYDAILYDTTCCRRARGTQLCCRPIRKLFCLIDVRSRRFSWHDGVRRMRSRELLEVPTQSEFLPVLVASHVAASSYVLAPVVSPPPSLLSTPSFLWHDGLNNATAREVLEVPTHP